MAALDRQYNRQLDFRLPRLVVNSLFSGGRRLLGSRPILPLLLALVLGIVAWGLVQLLPAPCESPSPPSLEEQEVYCLESEEERIRFYAKTSYEAIALGTPDYIEDALDSLQTSTSGPLDTSLFFNEYLKPVLGRIWEQAQQQYQDKAYLGAARYFGLAHKMLQAGAALSPAYGRIGSITMSRCLNWQGIAHFLAKDRSKADSIATVLGKLESSDSIGFPNLFTLLAYDYVDSVAYGRIRVRTGDGRYGFLDANTGEPTWSGGEGSL